jgi:hypothetical protein
VTFSIKDSLKLSGRRLDRSSIGLRSAGRVALWIAVGIVLIRGVGSIVSEPAATIGGAGVEAGGFPDDEARAFAVRFASAYLDPPPGGLAGYLADGLSDTAAVTLPRGPGAKVAWATVAREASLGDSRALVTVAALTDTGASRYVTVPVARDERGGLVVSALPSFSPPPPRAALGGEDVEPLTGPGSEAVGDLAERFLRAYLSGGDSDALAYLLAPGAAVTPMPGGLAVVSFDGADQIAATATVRRRSVRVSVTVRDRETGAVYPLGYRLEVARRDRWYVAAVAGGPGA